jgi:hypothetical protein
VQRAGEQRHQACSPAFGRSLWQGRIEEGPRTRTSSRMLQRRCWSSCSTRWRHRQFTKRVSRRPTIVKRRLSISRACLVQSSGSPADTELQVLVQCCCKVGVIERTNRRAVDPSCRSLEHLAGFVARLPCVGARHFLQDMRGLASLKRSCAAQLLVGSAASPHAPPVSPSVGAAERTRALSRRAADSFLQLLMPCVLCIADACGCPACPRCPLVDTLLHPSSEDDRSCGIVPATLELLLGAFA